MIPTKRHWLLSVLLLLAAAPPAAAQMGAFGKNKVQYRDFHWQVLSSPHLDVYYYPAEETVARLALAYGEESYVLLERRFSHHPEARIPLIVYASDQDFEQTNLLPGFIPEGVLGFTEYLKRRVALPFRGDYEQFRHTLRHELVHAFQISEILEVEREHPRAHRITPQEIQWWTEGLAEYWSSEQTAEDEMYVRDMVLHDELPTIQQFSRMYAYAAYPLGAELHKYLAARFGEQYIDRVYRDFWKYDSFEKTLEAVFGESLEQLSREWKYALQKRFFPVYADRPPLDVGARVVADRGANFKPIVYVPAGDSMPRVLFLSPRDGYTDLYETRLDRGEKGVHAILEGERSAGLESLHAYESRIDVNAGGRVALVARSQDRDALVIFDTRRRAVVARFEWPDLVGLRSPAWDPTGTRLVFEGISETGFSDLYTLDVGTGARAALTDDRYRDEDPDWSPDGSTIVFASDRTASGRDGDTNLFLYDLGSGRIRYLTFGRWHDQNPHWSHDGRRIAFSSDRSGFYDLYAVDAAGTGRRLTHLAGGAFDPAWLPDDRGLVFAGFSGQTFGIYHLAFGADSASAPAVALAPPPAGPLLAATGGNAPADSVGVAPIGWEWEDIQKPAVRTARAAPYRQWKKMSIDFAGAEAAVSPGYGNSQGVQFVASDLLGDHLIFAGISAFQAASLSQLVDNFSGQLSYVNLKHRLNWGAGAFRYRGLFRDVAWYVYDENTYGGFLLGAYPLSKFRRIEAQLRLQRSDRVDVSEFYRDLLLDQDTRKDPRSLTRRGDLASGYLSYVKDNTLWLPTGPIDGGRFNLTAGLVGCFACQLPIDSLGTLGAGHALVESYSLSADFRHYIRTSLRSAYAVRAYAFLSAGAIPEREVLGGPMALRGYPRFSLAGSRLLLLNQEWRFPLLHGIGLDFPFGRLTLPGIQGALFADLGSSWLERQQPDGAWGSYGGALRMPLGGPFVVRFDIGRRFALGDRPPLVFRRSSFDHHFATLFIGFDY